MVDVRVDEMGEKRISPCPAWLDRIGAPAIRLAALLGCGGFWVAVGYAVIA